MMNDSSRDKARQMAREFKIGITLLAMLFCVFIGVAYRRYRMSFFEPPSRSAAHLKESESSSPPAPDEMQQDSETPRALIVSEPTTFEPPDYEEADNSAFEIPPPVLPPPDAFVASEATGDLPSNDGSSGHAFQPTADFQEDEDVRDPLPLSAPSGGSFMASPSPPQTSPGDPQPAPPALAPPVQTEPATFEQKPNESGSVHRTQFEDIKVVQIAPKTGAQSDSHAPKTLQVDVHSKPIDKRTRVEPIREGDSFWLIAQRAYGNGAYFRALYEYNRDQFPKPDELPVGASVEIPSSEYLEQRFPEFCPSVSRGVMNRSDKSSSDPSHQRVYVVVGGESLFDVARFQLGQGSRYVEILQLNQEVLGDNLESLPAGLRLRLPDR